MRYAFILVVLSLLVACTSAPVSDDNAEPVIAPPAAQPEVAPVVTSDAAPAQETKVTEESVVKPEFEDHSVDLFSDIGCDGLLSVEDFAKICGLDPAKLSKTYRPGSKNCLVSVAKTDDRSLSAGVEVTKFKGADAASSELERRLQVRLAGASDSDIPGARTYVYDMVDRHNIEFCKGDVIVNIAANTKICANENLMELANAIAGRV